MESKRRNFLKLTGLTGSKRFYSMSSQILKERKEYYFQLEEAQKGTLDITEYLNWF
jgi:Fic family protein